jgi:hypothetical protein
MMSVIGLNARSPNIKRGILRIHIFWQLTCQSLPMQLTPWRQTVGFTLRSPSSDYSTDIEYQKTLYIAQQLRVSTGAWWASYITALPADHHVPWGEFYTTFDAHHLSADLLCTKLKEILDLEQGNHSVFDYASQFNTLAQYGSYHVDTDEQKANLYRAWLTIHL